MAKRGMAGGGGGGKQPLPSHSSSSSLSRTDGGNLPGSREGSFSSSSTRSRNDAASLEKDSYCLLQRRSTSRSINRPRHPLSLRQQQHRFSLSQGTDSTERERSWKGELFRQQSHRGGPSSTSTTSGHTAGEGGRGRLSLSRSSDDVHLLHHQSRNRNSGAQRANKAFQKSSSSSSFGPDRNKKEEIRRRGDGRTEESQGGGRRFPSSRSSKRLAANLPG